MAHSQVLSQANIHHFDVSQSPYMDLKSIGAVSSSFLGISLILTLALTLSGRRKFIGTQKKSHEFFLIIFVVLTVPEQYLFIFYGLRSEKEHHPKSV